MVPGHLKGYPQLSTIKTKRVGALNSFLCCFHSKINFFIDPGPSCNLWAYSLGKALNMGKKKHLAKTVAVAFVVSSQNGNRTLTENRSVHHVKHNQVLNSRHVRTWCHIIFWLCFVLVALALRAVALSKWRAAQFLPPGHIGAAKADKILQHDVRTLKKPSSQQPLFKSSQRSELWKVYTVQVAVLEQLASSN